MLLTSFVCVCGGESREKKREERKGETRPLDHLLVQVRGQPPASAFIFTSHLVKLGSLVFSLLGLVSLCLSSPKEHVQPPNCTSHVRSL